MNPVDEIISGLMPQAPAQQDPQASPVDSIINSLQENPDDVAAARQHTGDQSFNDLCERFVEQMAYGKTGLHGSASEAWNSYVKNGQAQAGLENIKPGNLVYFTPDQSNHNFGHAAIYSGNGNIIGATSRGVETMPIDKWQQMTGQQVLGNVSPQK